MFLRINKSFVLSRFFTTQASGSTEIRGEILEAALKHVNKVGWSQQALVQGLLYFIFEIQFLYDMKIIDE